jgi:ADP-ribosylglycohydrolase
LATARAILKLWIGVPLHRSGVWSAGNGPAMRAATIGFYAKGDRQLLSKLVKASTVLTHTDPAAEQGAMAIALAASFASETDAPINPEAFLGVAKTFLPGSAMVGLLCEVVECLARGDSVDQYLMSRRLDQGITGYINHTVPAAIFCWLRWQTDFRGGVEAAVLAGGDADTTAAIVGALIGCAGGMQGIPNEWSDSLAEFPRNVRWLKKLGSALTVATGDHLESRRQVSLFWPAVVFRNLFFLLVVLGHGVRRIFPPY